MIKDLAAHPRAYLTLREAWNYFAVDRRIVLKWIKAGVLPAYQFAGAWRIKTLDAYAFEQKNRYSSN